MKPIFLYRKLAAVVLLLLYLLVAVPVSLWHHHPEVSVNDPVMVQAGEKIWLPGESSADTGCSLCAHQFAVYLNDFVAPLSCIFRIPEEKNTLYFLPVIETRCSAGSNRGPPAIS